MLVLRNMNLFLKIPLHCSYYYFSFFCFHLIAMTSTVCNMLLYGWLNDNISQHLGILGSKFCCVGKEEMDEGANNPDNDVNQETPV